MVYNSRSEFQGAFTNLSCAQDTIRYRPTSVAVSSGWYVTDYITGRTYTRGQIV